MVVLHIIVFLLGLVDCREHALFGNQAGGAARAQKSATLACCVSHDVSPVSLGDRSHTF